MNHQSRNRSVLVALSLGLALVACGGEPDELTPAQQQALAAQRNANQPRQQAQPRPGQAAAKKRAQAKAEASKAPAPQTETAVVVRRFKPERDPFQSIYESRNRQEGPITHPLQQYTIPQLRLLGIIWGIAKPVGLVFAPDGREYIVRVGTPVGTGDGRVVAILPDRVVIVERYYDYRGQLQTEKYELTLPSEGSK